MKKIIVLLSIVFAFAGCGNAINYDKKDIVTKTRIQGFAEDSVLNGADDAKLKVDTQIEIESETNITTDEEDTNESDAVNKTAEKSYVNVDEVDSEVMKSVSSFEELQVEDAVIETQLNDMYYGLYEIKEVEVDLFTKSQVVPYYIEINDTTITFRDMNSDYYQSFTYIPLKKNEHIVDIKSYVDSFGIEKYLVKSYRLRFSYEKEQLKIDVKTLGNSTSYEQSLYGSLVDLENEDIQLIEDIPKLVYEQVDMDEYLLDKWLAYINQENKTNTPFYGEYQINEMNFETNNVIQYEYNFEGVEINEWVRPYELYRWENKYYMMFENSSVYYVIEKVDDVSATLKEEYVFPIFSTEEKSVILRKDLTIEEAGEQILALNGSNQFSEEELLFFNKKIKGEWQELVSEPEVSGSKLLIGNLLINLVEYGTESSVPCYYTIVDINIEESRITLEYQFEGIGDEFNSASEPIDYRLVLKRDGESLKILEYDTSNENEFYKRLVGVKYLKAIEE